MKELHRKDPASHSGPESCDANRKVCGEALTGEDAGEVWSHEIDNPVLPTLLSEAEGKYAASTDDVLRQRVCCQQDQEYAHLDEINAYIVLGIYNVAKRIKSTYQPGQRLPLVAVSADFAFQGCDEAGSPETLISACRPSRVIADNQLDAEVKAIASRLARFDHDAIARTKSFVDQITLPDNSELGPAWNDFIELFHRRDIFSVQYYPQGGEFVS